MQQEFRMRARNQTPADKLRNKFIQLAAHQLCLKQTNQFTLIKPTQQIAYKQEDSEQEDHVLQIEKN